MLTFRLGADVIEYFAGLAPAMQGSQQDLDSNTFFISKREPLGVCVGIGAWNYPIQIACWKSAACLAAETQWCLSHLRKRL